MDKSGRKKGIMWVHAPAGFGKTAVAGTVTEKLKAMAIELGFDPIGATFFFWRTSPERSSPASFIITLAYQLAQSIPDLGPRVEAVVKSKPDIVKMGLELQVVKLIVEPFKSLPNLDSMPKRLVVVDGIDECINSDQESRAEKKYAEDQETAQIRVLDLIHSLQSHQLPLSFLVLSRPEAWIKQHLGSSAFREVVEPLDLYKVGDHMDDVAKFVRAELSRIATTHGLGNADEEWAEEKQLVWRSKGQMVYISTVLRHIDDPYGDPRQLLKDIVDNTSTTSPDISHSTAFSSLYELYGQIIRSCPQRNRALMMEVLEYILIRLPRVGSCEAELAVLDSLSGRTPGCALKALRPLHAVLALSGERPGSIDRLFIHSSFKEFLQSPHLSSDLLLDLSKREEFLLSKTLDCMASITTDTIGKELDGVTRFALLNWFRLWEMGKNTFLKSKPTGLYMMKKIIGLDLTTCIIHTYCTPDGIFAELPPFRSLFYSNPPCTEPSRFLVDSMESDGCRDTLSTIRKVTSHFQASFDDAFTIFLQATTPGTSDTRPGSHCAAYLEYGVTTTRDWKKHKLVQALGAPGPGALPLFMSVVSSLQVRLRSGHYDDTRKKWAWDLLAHIYDVMVRHKHPILESEVHPFHYFLLMLQARLEQKPKAAQIISSPVLKVAKSRIFRPKLWFSDPQV
jgi:hypothetical protein